MCGIAGIWHRGDGQETDRGLLTEMVACVRHRGPDDQGVFVEDDIGLAHRRLAILDLSGAGHQPMTTPDGRFTLVFNGEIYNYQELQEKYLAGVELRSSSDSEVLLHLLAQQGAEALTELRGMFAFVLWDKQERKLLAARDPFGKKPLYYAEQEGAFLFASEVKSLLKADQGLSGLDRRALAKYFLYEYVPAPATGWADIRQLPMGHMAVVSEDTLEIKQWWRPELTPKHAAASEQEILNELDERLAVSVERRMIADVPVGLLLSGGLDSTTIGWYMKQQAKSELHSFSVSFDEKSFNEGDYAKAAAKALDMTHHDVKFDLDSFWEVLDDLVEQMDIPFGDASLLPTLVVSRLARSEIVVALDGDGSDELLGGYGTFQAAAVADRLPRLPKWAGAWAEEMANLWPTNLENFSFDFKLKSFVNGLTYVREQRNQIWLGSFSDKELAGLLSTAWREELAYLFEDIDLIAPPSKKMATLDAVSWLTVHHYLQNDILVKLDRATMLTSLEARTPFLDVDLAEFLMKLPVRFKRNKYALRQLMRGRIPDEIIDRPKQGFGIPLGYWLKGPLYNWAKGVLSEDKIKSQRVLRYEAVRRLLEEHRRGKADHRKKLWTLLVWQLWYDRWAS